MRAYIGVLNYLKSLNRSIHNLANWFGAKAFFLGRKQSY
tara:strand:- start:91410 stop:91526 length:117 start_codon:yes stop_codon:yes gene_type:complete